MEKVLHNIAHSVEKELDDEIERLNQLDSDDIERIRQQRLDELKKRAQLKQEWVANGHGEYKELTDEMEFFEASKKSKDMVVHFYKQETFRCKIVDKHLQILAPKHKEARFVKIDVERCPFLTKRLSIRIIPTIALIKDSKTSDYIVGFTDLGNCDDFSTAMMEWRIARANVIEYNGDLTVPPEEQRKQRLVKLQGKKTIRGKISDDSDDDFSD